MQTKPPGALVIDTGGSDMERNSDMEEDEEDEYSITNSPEPPEPIEQGEGVEMQVDGQPGTIHPEQSISHIFRNIQKTLTELPKEDLYKFKLSYTAVLGREREDRRGDEENVPLRELFEGDLLDLVDRLIERFGLGPSLTTTISTLQNISKHKEAAELQENCKKALLRFSLKNSYVRQFQYCLEGIPQPGKRKLLDDIYVEPEVWRCSCGGFYPYHEFRNPQPMIQSPPPDSAVNLRDVFRLQKPDGQPVRTVLTTGLAGSGMSMSVARFCYEWAEERSNRDFQYVLTLPLFSFWGLREQTLSSANGMSIMDVIEHNHSLCKTKTYLDDENCKFLIILDSFEGYQTLLDWKNTPVIKESNAPVKVLDHLIVNLIRGNLLPHARLWILGRQASVSYIPSEFIDVSTEIHGFNDEMRDSYVRKHCKTVELANRCIHRFRQLPTLRSLSLHPCLTWLMNQIFTYNYKRYTNYGFNPPKLTSFFVNALTYLINRRLETYFDIADSYRRWSKEDRKMLASLGRMALKMLERSIFEFGEEDLKEYNLDLMDVTVFSGLCIELPRASTGKRRFCFFHASYLDFMAAVYVRYLFRWEFKNALAHLNKGFKLSDRAKSAADIVQSAINLTFKSPLGHYDLFLRFVCGLFSRDSNKQLEGHLIERRYGDDTEGVSPELKELQKKTLQTCPPERKENLEECFRELTQVDD